MRAGSCRAGPGRAGPGPARLGCGPDRVGACGICGRCAAASAGDQGAVWGVGMGRGGVGVWVCVWGGDLPCCRAARARRLCRPGPLGRAAAAGRLFVCGASDESAASFRRILLGQCIKIAFSAGSSSVASRLADGSVLSPFRQMAPVGGGEPGGHSAPLLCNCCVQHPPLRRLRRPSSTG